MPIEVIDKLIPKGGKFKLLDARDIEVSENIDGVKSGISSSYKRLCGVDLIQKDIYSLEEALLDINKIFQNIFLRAGEGQGSLILNTLNNQDSADPIAKGKRSLAEGRGSEAIGDYSHSEGNFSSAYGKGSHTEGNITKAFGDFSHAEGYDNVASGSNSHAEGRWTSSGDESSHAEGTGTRALGEHSHAEGYYNYADAAGSHAEGAINKVLETGSYAHAEGYNNTASGLFSHVEGGFSNVSGNYAHAEGEYAKSSGRAAHSEGYYSEASGLGAHAEGQSKALNDFAHAEGQGTVTSAAHQHVQGKYNVYDGVDVENAVHIVGWGTADARKNIHTLDQSGNAYFSGNIKSPTINTINANHNSLTQNVEQLTESFNNAVANHHADQASNVAILNNHLTHLKELDAKALSASHDIAEIRATLQACNTVGQQYVGLFDDLPTLEKLDSPDINGNTVKLSGKVTIVGAENEKVEYVKLGAMFTTLDGTEYIIEKSGDDYIIVPLTAMNTGFANLDEKLSTLEENAAEMEKNILNSIDMYHPIFISDAVHSGDKILRADKTQVDVISTITTNKLAKNVSINNNSLIENYETLSDNVEITTNDKNTKTEYTITTRINAGNSSSINNIVKDEITITIDASDGAGNNSGTAFMRYFVYPIYAGIFKVEDINDKDSFDDIENEKLQTSLTIDKMFLSGQTISEDYANNPGESSKTYLFYGIPKDIMDMCNGVRIEWFGGMYEFVSRTAEDQVYNITIGGIPYTFLRSEQVILSTTISVQSIDVY